MADVRTFGRKLRDHEIIWRYMDVAKLESVLEDEALYFAATHEFTDAFEGSITRYDLAKRLKSLEGFAPDTEAFYHGAVERAFFGLRKLTKINCWHRSEYESLAMWQLYIREGKGVAIRSTVGRLKRALKAFRLKPEYGEETIWVGSVSYIDYREQQIAGGDAIAPFFHKRQSFSHEKELRALVSLRMASEFGVKVPDKGIKVSVDLTELVETVFLAPALTDEARDEIQQLIAAYRLFVPVVRSNLDDSPVF